MGTDSIDLKELYDESLSFLRCEQCGIIWFLWKGFGQGTTPYVPVKQ